MASEYEWLLIVRRKLGCSHRDDGSEEESPRSAAADSSPAAQNYYLPIVINTPLVRAIFVQGRAYCEAMPMEFR